ncbi:MAG: lamin tail domain-containing protein [Verrucomicrobia subdivision 3 bacterium]|nr:lamin tail domain-containing protein [Limisphaerales bacterium]
MNRFVLSLVCAGLCSIFRADAQFLPNDVGTTVAGFQDDFDGGSLNPNWVLRGVPVFSVSDGLLRVTSTLGDPNHLLCELPGYNTSVQEVLARIRVTDFGTGDPSRGGVAAAVASGNSQGINWLFRDEPNPGQRHIEFLDDARAWGTELSFSWQNDTWYWLRLRHEPNAPSLGGVNDVFGKIWLADGSQPEPAAWQATYDYTPARSARTGFAGITATSLGGTAEFEVDYVLIKASGLPNITVAPTAFTSVPVAITNQPQSQTVVEGSSVTFSVGARGNPPPTFQWHRNNTPIPGATNSSFTIPVVALTDHGATFKVVAQNIVSNTTHTVTSSNAVLTVEADGTPPTLVLAQALGLTQVQIAFSERVAPATATNRFNYQITNSSGLLVISSAVLDGSQTNVLLNVSTMTEGAMYTLVVNNIADTSSAENLIAPNTTITFSALSFTSAMIGNPQPPGGTTGVTGGVNITAGGRDIGGTSDQFQFSYQPRTGDFDVKVRLDSLSRADAWSEAGLLAREDLNGGGRFASVLATPNISGAYFQSRVATNGAANIAGSFPVNFPNMWLRLKRVGNSFQGFAGIDGQYWTLLGSASIAMPPGILLGFAASSHNTNETITAAFRDFSNVTSTSIRNAPLPAEPLGQSSRRTSLVISEIMYNPRDRADGRNLEFVELFNSLGTPQNLSGWRLDGDADFTFAQGTVIPGGGFLVIAQAPADMQAVYGITGVLGPFSNTNSLPNDRGTVQLRNRIGAVFLEANYDTDPPWPVSADGAGHSLVLARPSYGEGNVEAWAASDSVGGSPGRLDPVTADPHRNVVINEFLAHTDEPQLDFIELYNHGTIEVDISGCFLSDARNTNKFTVPPGTILPPRGFVSFNQDQLGFALSSSGENIYFRNAADSRVLDAVRFEAQANGVSSGRFPDGAPRFSELASPTEGTNNSPLLQRDVVINEIMYNPISRDSDDEFIELHNRGATAVSVARWRLTGGISFTFPANGVIPAGGYLVVARDAARLITRYPTLSSINTVGDYDGSLANGGERIALAMPDPSITTNGSVVITNYSYIVIDEVAYRDGGRWGQWSDGGGSSLELIDPRSDNRLAANWADSDETAKAPWTIISVRGVLDNGTSPADQLQVLLQGAGECLMDDVEVLTLAGANLIANSTFEGGIAGWTAEGTQQPSSLETTEGYNSARSYHVRATDRGDNQVNRIRTPLTAAQAANTTNTIRAKVRWLRGHPEILFRLRGNWHEAAIAMDLPTNLGTPGARNSRAVMNAPPAIYDVTHFPPVPADGQDVVVTARVHDPDGVAVELKYRTDPTTGLTTVAMLDNGTGGDAVAGDGLYSATISGRPLNTLIAFHVRATDGFSPNASATFPNNAPVRECLVRFGEAVPSGNFPSYRFWMTQASFNAWDARHNLNNTLNDTTFVLGNHRVVYNVGAVYAGSPYIGPSFDTPTGRRCGYSIEFPPDDQFLGDSALVLDWPGGHGNENTAIQEQMAYWIAEQIDIAYSHRYHIRLTVNGVTDMARGGVFEAVVQPNADFLEQWSPGDSEGDFVKIDRAFEFSDAGGLIADPEPQLRVYTTPDLVNGGSKKKTEKYRWYWLKRAYDSANDYTNLFTIADALNATSPEPYTSQTEALADVEQWMAIFAVEHIINNFDSWGHDIGKNMYMFKPRDGRWQLYLFDLDWLMLVSPGGPGNYTASTGPLFSSDDPTVTRMYNHPPFRRAYFRAVEKAVNKAFVASKYEPVMDAKYNSLVANGVTLCDGQTLANPAAVKTWFSQRRTYLANQLNAVSSGFAITSNGGSDFSTNSDLVTLTGTAPVSAKGIRVNGIAYPIAWTSVSNWTMRIPLQNGANSLSLQAYDPSGAVLSNYNDTITITSTAPPESPVGHVVINEIMYNPPFADAEFVELYNTSAITTFDLSGWRINGIDFTFASGTLLSPGGYLVVVKDRDAFAAAHGSLIPAAGEFAGDLDRGGETLSLVKPGATPDQDLLIDVVTYDDDPPWPVAADGGGPSLQLIDATRDNMRVSNWSDGSGWRFFTATTNLSASSNQFRFYLGSAGQVFVDDIMLVAGPVAQVGENLIRNGDFSGPLLTNEGGPWSFSQASLSNTVITTEVAHSGNTSLRLVHQLPGPTTYLIQNGVIVPSAGQYTLSFWYLPITNNTTLTAYVNSSFRPAPNVRIVRATPSAVNSTAAPLPPFPPVFVNELQPNNLTGITDNFGERQPWVELYNSGPDPVSLNGWHLTDSYTNLTRWPFPPAQIIGPGQFLLVWLDGEPHETDGTNVLHSNFQAVPGNGSLALVFPLNQQPAVLDYVNYNIIGERSIGYYPDGEAGPRQTFFNATPGAANNNTAAPLSVFINEWMAANTSFMVDPTDGTFDDWFELCNLNDVDVDLTGYSLSDRLEVGGPRWSIPAGTIVPAHGFLLVWADEDPGENTTNGSALHADFRLSQSGEAIGLFAPNGTVIDSVTFGVQTNNVSEGRWPDGSVSRYFMPTPTPAAANIIPVIPPADIEIVETKINPQGNLVISWSAEPGITYRVQFTESLDTLAWMSLPNVTAAGSVAATTNTFSVPPLQRFYRVQRVSP